MSTRVRQWNALVITIVSTLCLLASGCGGVAVHPAGSTLSIPAGSTLSIPTISASLTPGATSQLSAIASIGTQGPQNVTSSVIWASSNVAVATVDASGVLSAVTPGITNVTASYGAVSASLAVTIGQVALSAIAIAPNPVSLAAGAIQQYSLAGTYSNGTTGPVAAGVVWAVTPNTLATINAAGLLTAIAPGSFRVLANVGAVSTSSTGTVTAPTLTQLTLGPQLLSLVSQGVQQLVATGTYSNGTTGPVSTGVVWTVSPNTIATIDAAGLLTALAPGSFRVSSSVGAVSTSSTGTVTAPTLTQLTLGPLPLSLVSQAVQQLVATGTYSNGTTGPVSTGVVWTVSPNTVATISSVGLLTALAPGSFTISSSAGALSASATGLVTTPPPTALIAAGRLLNQTTFGPTADAITHVEQVGIEQYLKEQFSMPVNLMPTTIPSSEYTGDCVVYDCAPEAWWWQRNLFGPDQLRQRVAFALSKLFVVSYNALDARYYPFYLNALSADAFGNWQTLMHDVALTPAMGYYLDMGNSKAPSLGVHADENFARELMQLFSIGTVALNLDGSAKLDSHGNTIPNYTPDEVQSFARAYTGFTYVDGNCSSPSQLYYYFYDNPPGLSCPMAPVEQYHDKAQKTLLRGTVLPANQDAAADFGAAIANVFEDPSLPPFVCRRLIQNLVTSNPSPEYIERIANVFINDGTGVRGNLKAVLTAILLDPEARAGDDGSTPLHNAGLMRDPVLWWSSILRALYATQVRPDPNNGIYDNIFDLWLLDLGESPHKEPSVFSFYSPNYVVDGGSLYAPELELENSYSIPEMMRHVQDMLDDNFNQGPNANDVSLDLSTTSPLGQIASSSGPGPLVDALNGLLLHGTMSAAMRTTIVAAIAGQSPSQMAENAVYLIVTSPQYKVML